MRIDALALRNFRNYDALNVTFAPDCNVIVGENAQGKTNLLEAIVYLSFRPFTAREGGKRAHFVRQERMQHQGERVCAQPGFSARDRARRGEKTKNSHQ